AAARVPLIRSERSVAVGEPIAGQAAHGVPAAGGGPPPQHHQAPPGWRQGGPGRVRALGGGLAAARRAAAVGVFPEDARYGRYADLVLSLALRGELVVPEQHLPVRQRHEHDVPARYATEEGRRNYDRVLHMLQPS
uniref:hypothetical protein n=1 Tax=Nonomuraea sp. SBT364 TaxID=1580530 RepID=UPI00066A3EDB